MEVYSHEGGYEMVRLSSGLLAIFIFLVTVVIELSAALVNKIERIVETKYMLTLYSIGFLYTVYHLILRYANSELTALSLVNCKSTNRFLKGVIALFGLAILLKEVLNFLKSTFFLDYLNCFTTRIQMAMHVVHVAFIMVQVMFLFSCTKIYSHPKWRKSIFPRFGLMLIIAINLSTWFSSVVYETQVALKKYGSPPVYIDTEMKNLSFNGNKSDVIDLLDDSNNTLLLESPFADDDDDGAITDDDSTGPAVNDSSTVDIPVASLLYASHPSEEEDTEELDKCYYCNDPFCKAVLIAEKFLYPYLIEFCLVSSCLIFNIWSNIGKPSSNHSHIVKPSYRFHGSYAGVVCGAIAFFATILAVIFLGTASSDVGEDLLNGTDQEVARFLVHDLFLIAIKVAMIISCIIGFWYFHLIPASPEHAPMMDVVLLILCLVSPLTLDIFSLLGVFGSKIQEIDMLIVTRITLPICDILQQTLQLVLILGGLQREPITSVEKEIDLFVQDKLAHTSCANNNKNSMLAGYVNHALERDETMMQQKQQQQRLSTATRTISKDSNENNVVSSYISYDSCFCDDESHLGTTNTTIELQQAVPKTTSASPNEDQISAKNDVSVFSEPPPSITVLPPDGKRLVLKNTILFLLLTNTALWVFMSLEGVAFSTHLYEAEFFGTTTWATTYMICKPLKIFYHMHCAGCFFEMWSLA